MLARRRHVPFARHVQARCARGVTLVELVITLVVASVLFAIAIPNFNNLINSNRLTTAANSLVGALNNARMEAIKRNASVQFCSNSATTNNSDTLGTACGTSAGAVVVQLTPASASSMLAPPSALSIASIQVRNSAAVRFNGTGLGYAPGSTTPFGSGTASNTVVELCSTALRSNNDITISMATGSIISSATSTATTCP